MNYLSLGNSVSFSRFLHVRILCISPIPPPDWFSVSRSLWPLADRVSIVDRSLFGALPCGLDTGESDSLFNLIDFNQNWLSQSVVAIVEIWTIWSRCMPPLPRGIRVEDGGDILRSDRWIVSLVSAKKVSLQIVLFFILRPRFRRQFSPRKFLSRSNIAGGGLWAKPYCIGRCQSDRPRPTERPFAKSHIFTV